MRLVVGASAVLAVLAGLAALLREPRTAAERLLFIEGRAVRWARTGGVATAADGSVIMISSGTRARRLSIGDGAAPAYLDAAVGEDGTLWLVDEGGGVVRRDPDGAITELGATPFDRPTLAVWAGGIWAARSPLQFTFRPEPDTARIAVRLDDRLASGGGVGRITVPGNPFLVQLANSAHVMALPDGGVIVAPFVRDEVVAFDAGGRERWRVRRGLAHETPDPTLVITRGTAGTAVEVDYVPVNLGLAQADDGTLYVLSTVAARTDSSRIDAIDPETGAVLRTWRLATPLPTVAVNRRGELREVDPTRLLPTSTVVEREAFEPFALPSPHGDTIRLADAAGRVALINIWASWCGPCRQEMPLLDSLAGALDSTQAVVFGLSDDASPDAARRFIAEGGYRSIRFALGGGRLRRRYHYFGLPYTVLLDRNGRVAGRWPGYAGAHQVAQIAERITTEIAAGLSEAHHH